jgi:GNAT superfamily N-acetyltransferase
MNVRYRDADSKDKKDVFSLAKLLATSFTPTEDEFSKIYSSLMSDKHVDLIVAQNESELIGYILVFHHPTFYANGVISWVEELLVLEDYRGLNIGRGLMEKVENQAIQRGSKLVALATRRASEFYKAIGYEESASYFKKSL